MAALACVEHAPRVAASKQHNDIAHCRNIARAQQ